MHLSCGYQRRPLLPVQAKHRYSNATRLFSARSLSHSCLSVLLRFHLAAGSESRPQSPHPSFLVYFATFVGEGKYICLRPRLKFIEENESRLGGSSLLHKIKTETMQHTKCTHLFILSDPSETLLPSFSCYSVLVRSTPMTAAPAPQEMAPTTCIVCVRRRVTTRSCNVGSDLPREFCHGPENGLPRRN